jgi:hypothetical protein
VSTNALLSLVAETRRAVPSKAIYRQAVAKSLIANAFAMAFARPGFNDRFGS